MFSTLITILKYQFLIATNIKYKAMQCVCDVWQCLQEYVSILSVVFRSDFGELGELGRSGHDSSSL